MSKKGQLLILELIERKKEIQKIEKEMHEIESNLNGMEITFNGKLGTLDAVDGNNQNAYLYLEDESGEQTVEIVSLHDIFHFMNA